MNNEHIHIEQVRVGDLPDFVRRNTGEGVVSISEHRALAHSRNPHASPDDIGLLVAYQGTRLVGYLGLLPGRLRVSGTVAPVVWMSTWLVSPEMRGQRVGYRLLEAAMALGVDLLGTAFTRSAGRVMRAAGFQEMGLLEYYVVDFYRFTPWTRPFTSLARRLRRAGHGGGRAAGALRRLDQLGGWPVKAAVYRIATSGSGLSGGNARVESVAAADAKLLPESAAVDGSAHFLRGPEIVRWMLEYPWVLEASEAAPHDAEHYHFSDTRRLFRRIPLRITAPGTSEPAAFVVLSVSNAGERTDLRVLDYALHTPGAADLVVQVALRHAAEFNADSLVFPNAFAAALRRHPWTRPFLRRRTRKYLCHPAHADSPLARAADRIQLGYCDADTAFT